MALKLVSRSQDMEDKCLASIFPVEAQQLKFWVTDQKVGVQIPKSSKSTSKVEVP